jgi:hypothetical protein
MIPMNAQHLERAKLLANAARRRADIERWRETYQRILTTPGRTPDEAVAKHQALELLERARP